MAMLKPTFSTAETSTILLKEILQEYHGALKGLPDTKITLYTLTSCKIPSTGSQDLFHI